MKYKLIKEYPGYTKEDIGKIAIKQNNSNAQNCYLFNDKYYIPMSIENYPEFWKEIIEKDYEILSLQCIVNPNKGLIYNVVKNEVINSNGDPCLYSIQNALEFWVEKHKSWIIHSIKRLSDGEVFTIGDNIDGQNIKNKKITGFKLIQENLVIQYNNITLTLNNISKCKKPLFTTEDGVDIFEGDYYFPVEKMYSFYIKNKKIIFVLMIKNL